MFVKVISICALLVGIGGLLMSLARTGPEEAAANLSRWIAWFQIPKIQGTLKTIFAEVARSWSWRFIFVCLVALGCLGIIWSLKGPEAVTPLAPAVPPAGPPNSSQKPAFEQPLAAPQAENPNELPPLTIQRQRALVSALAALKPVLPNILITYPVNAGVLEWVRELAKVFERAGITPSMGLHNPGGPDETGVMIAAHDPNKLPDAAIKLFQIFASNGMRPKVVLLPANIGTEFSFS